MTTRKTITVTAVREQANRMLAESAPDQVQGREAVAVMVSALLSQAGVYKGYRYLDGAGLTGDDTRRFYL